MKIKHICNNCNSIWTSEVRETSCPNCPESDVTATEVLDFRDQPQGSSLNRQACYTISHGEETILTGRSSKKDIEKGMILTGVPYKNFQRLEFKIKNITYRPHKGEHSKLFHWTAKCEVL